MNDLMERVLNASHDGTLLTFIGTHPYGEKDTLAAALVELDSTRQIDFPALVMSVERPQGHSTQFFRIRDITTRVIPKLDRPVPIIMDSVLHLLVDKSIDKFHGIIIEPFIQFCRAGSGRSQEAFGLATKDPGQYGILIPATLTGWSAHDLRGALARCMELSTDSKPEIANQGAFAIGLLTYANDHAIAAEALEFVLKSMAATTRDDLFYSLLSACSALPMGLTPDFMARWIPMVQQVTSRDTPKTIHQVVRSLMAALKNIDPGHLDALLPEVCKVSSSHRGTLEDIDYLAVQMIGSGFIAKAATIVETVTTRAEDPVDVASFDDFQHTIMTSGKLSWLATRWFLSGEPALCNAIGGMAGGTAGEPALKVDPEGGTSITDQQLLFIARKAVGFLFIHPVTASSFVVSCMSHCTLAQVRTAIADLFLKPLLLNFSGKLADYLRREVERQPELIADEIKQRLAAHDQWLTELKALPVHRELEPSTQHTYIRRRLRHDMMKSTMAKAEAESPLLQLAHRITLLYGARSANAVHLGGGQYQREVMEMKASSVEFEMPRLPTLDPWGFDVFMRRLRGERRKNS